MLDASKYEEYFPAESEPAATADAKTASAPHTVAPSPSLLAALSQLEKEFKEILRAQESEPTDPSE
jgi:hypothetical protein